MAMTNQEILKRVDHTLLASYSTWEEIQALCDESIKYKTASICIPPGYVKRVTEKYGDSVNICTVIGFPLGYNCTQIKAEEAKLAILEGANELDVVINQGDAKNGDFAKITDELRILKQAAGDKVLKVIIETCNLTEKEKIELCHCVTDSGADFIKTSTGFGKSGATIEDIELFKKHIGAGVRVKAAGGVRTKEDLEMFINAGCDRIGTSSAVKLLAGETDNIDY